MHSYKRFGIMLDCSRNRVMRPRELCHLIDCLEKMGYNAIELYTEDTLSVAGEPYLGYLRGAYTKDEIRAVDAYAKERGIELIPCIQTLAHFTNTVKFESIREFVDVDDILLIGHEKTYEFIEHIFAQLAEDFTTRQVNIGMDEAYMVGLGKYLRENGLRDRLEIIGEHLDRVAKIAAKYGFTCHMWSDMFFRAGGAGHPYAIGNRIPAKIAERIPENVALTFWDYYRTDKAYYDDMFAGHIESGKEVWFAGGAWTWLGFHPYNRFSLETMRPAITSAMEHNIKNVLITMWGDCGGECSPFSVLPSLYALRQFGDGNFDMESIKAGFYKLFNVSFDDFLLLDLPNEPAKAADLSKQFLKLDVSTKTYLYNDPFLGQKDPTVTEYGTADFAAVEKKLRDAMPRVGEFAYLFDVAADLCSLMEIKAGLGLRARAAYQADDIKGLRAAAKDCREAVRRLDTFRDSFHASWMREAKPFGWEVQEVRLGGLRARLIDCGKRLDMAAEDPDIIIDELECNLLPDNLNHLEHKPMSLLSPAMI